MKKRIYFFKIKEYYNPQFQISNSLKPHGTGDPFYGLVHNPRGESLKKVGLLRGPNPTANLVSVILRRKVELVRQKN
ncbi:hypothetical protein D0U04_19545 [Bacillus clarus]|uniref:Uncharacterized protein n=1 Tax=Bacillus clarus TaxID=2338372 RepID=A0ABX9KSK4_9BACI|nr:hypothetical protein D0U04_19545 [Bacillus clarus]